MHGSVSGLLLTVGVFETVIIDREESDVTSYNNKQTNKITNFLRMFPFWGSQQIFQLISATRSTISRSLVAVLGQINAVPFIPFHFFKIHCNTNLPSSSRSLQVPLSLRSSSPLLSTHYCPLEHLRLAEAVSSSLATKCSIVCS